VYSIIDEFMADPQARDEAPTIEIDYPAGAADQGKQAETHLTKYGIPAAWIKLVQSTDAAAPPGIFDLTGKPYTVKKMTDLFDLKPLDVEPGDDPAGIDVLVRLGPETDLKSP
jgi:hypothetical protein